MELKNSLGCKLCKTPLEICERVNEINVCKRLGCNCTRDLQNGKTLMKYEGTFRQQLLQGARAEELDPQAVASRCGHIFHRGCLKKMTTELNTSCIECPICLKPIVLAHLWPLDFYCPDSESARHPKTLPAKVRSMNDRNNSLLDELTALRRLREHKEKEQRELSEAVSILKQNISKRTQQLDSKLNGLFGSSTIDEQYEENIRFEKEAILDRVKALTRRNTELLATIEERAKLNYINEEERADCIRSLQCKIRECRLREKMGPEAGQVVPARILNKPKQVSLLRNPELKIEEIIKPINPNRKFALPSDSIETHELPLSMEVNLSGRLPTEEHMPLATVTRSMQELLKQNTDRPLISKYSNGDGDTPQNSIQAYMAPICYLLPSPEGSGDDTNEQSQPVGAIRTGTHCEAEVCCGDTEPCPDACWNERFKHIRNRAAERQINAPRLLATKPLKLRISSKTNLRRKRSAKMTQSPINQQVREYIREYLQAAQRVQYNLCVECLADICFNICTAAAASALVQQINPVQR